MDPTGPILIVDDEDDLLSLVDMNLRREGFATRLARTAREALEALDREPLSLVLLDMMLPDMPGTEVCRRLRAHPTASRTPVIILSARGEEIDRVVGFEVGADDYVVKSNLSMRELALRVRAVLRRREAEPASESEGEATGHLTWPHLTLDVAAHRVFVDEGEIPLTATEFRLLYTLASRQGRVQSRGALLKDVWDMPPDLNTRTVDTHVKRLREKLGVAADYVETVRGVGYRFHVDGEGT